MPSLADGRFVQYGCGMSAPPGWRNFDASPTLRFERLPLVGRLYAKNRTRFPENVEYGDIVRGLPVPPSSCEGVYCSHVLEHLALTDFRLALRNTWRILVPGGLFRMVLPDLEQSVKAYSADPTEAAAPAFMQETGLGVESRATGLGGLLASWLGNSRHLWMWDFKSIEPELRASGFVAIRRASFGDGSEPAFREVEDEERWNGCLGVECRRPK
jgi:SAM-dependent methyltransferase